MPDPDPDTGVRLEQDAARGRYVLIVGGTEAGFVAYRERDGVVWLDHAEVAPRLRGGGVGADLVARTLAHVRGEGRSVVPVCGYVARYVRDHPEHADLLHRPVERHR